MARATLVESNIGPIKLPYVPPNNASFAISELRPMTGKLKAEKALGREIRRDVQQATDSIGVAPDGVLIMMDGVVPETNGFFQTHTSYAPNTTVRHCLGHNSCAMTSC